MSTDLVRQNGNLTAEALEKVLLQGDLSTLTPDERISYYLSVCRDLNLNPKTQPFEYLKFQGKLVLYARRNCTDQLLNIHQASVAVVRNQQLGEMYLATARVDVGLRSVEDVGAVWTEGLRGEAMCNAVMKAHTKAMRRATLRAFGLSYMDETETESVPGAERISFPEDSAAVERAASKIVEARIEQGEVIDTDVAVEDAPTRAAESGFDLHPYLQALEGLMSGDAARLAKGKAEIDKIRQHLTPEEVAVIDGAIATAEKVVKGA